jgi:hypothetical protein
MVLLAIVRSDGVRKSAARQAFAPVINQSTSSRFGFHAK